MRKEVQREWVKLGARETTTNKESAPARAAPSQNSVGYLISNDILASTLTQALCVTVKKSAQNPEIL